MFFAALAAFALFWAWLLLAASAGRPPITWLRSLLPADGAARADSVVPISRYLKGGYGLRSISPSDMLASSINENGGKIVIGFEEPMDLDTSDILTAADVYTEGEEAFEFRNFSWPDERTFVVSLPRDLLPNEFIGLEFRFKTAEGRLLPPIELMYR